MLKRFLATALLSCAAYAEDTTPAVKENILVYGKLNPALSLEVNKAHRPLVDGAEHLRFEIPGFDAIRISGHGLDPVYRGLRESNFTVKQDGAEVHCACPGRMSPETAYAASSSYDNIYFLRGGQTVSHGPATGAGVIVYERARPDFSEKDYHLNLSSSYNSQGGSWEHSGSLVTGTEDYYLRLNGNWTDAGNYEDGDNEEVRTAFRNSGGSVALGLTPDEDTLLEFSYEYQREDDVLFAGRGMDGIKTTADVFRFKYEQANISELVSLLKFNAYYSDVYHVMDNFSLRTPGMMRMETEADSTTYGAAFSLGLDLSDDLQATVGVDYKNNNRKADRQTTMMMNSFEDALWPDATISNLGFFAEAEYTLSEDSRLIGGLRLDYVEAEADKTDSAGWGGLTADDLYNSYYGKTASKEDELNVSGFLRLEQDINDTLMAYINLSRMVRTADATERYMASPNMMNAMMRWVGNPHLDPEKHHQIDLGLQYKTEETSSNISIFYNRVDDYILRTRTNVMGDNATIYRNVDADLYGLEFSYEQRVFTDWKLGGQASYLRGRNESDGSNLAQISPLKGNIFAEYTPEQKPLLIGARLNWADQQNDVDTDPMSGSGLDVDNTPGFATVDLYASWKIQENTTLNIGIDNLFDKNYAQHLNQGNSFDSTQVQINDPGRAFWIKLDLEF